MRVTSGGSCKRSVRSESEERKLHSRAEHVAAVCGRAVDRLVATGGQGGGDGWDSTLLLWGAGEQQRRRGLGDRGCLEVLADAERACAGRQTQR